MRQLTLFWAVVFLTAGVVGAQTTIEISGLTGAEHWVWAEAEDALTGGSTAVANWHDSYGISAGNRNPDAVWDPWTSGGSWVTMQFDTPAAMSNAFLYMRYGASGSISASTLKVDGVTVGTVEFPSSNGSGFTPSQMEDTGAAMGALSRGGHVLKIEHPGSYCDHSYDGFFVYENGNMDVNNAVVTFGDQWGPYYIAPPVSLDAPVVAPAVKPVITFTNRQPDQGYEIKIVKDGGTPVNFFSGSVIDEPGDYQLYVYVWFPSSRWFTAYAGANFKVGGSAVICPQGDLSDDCAVNMVDLAMLANQWLQCNDPQDPDCL